jgi:hypothetical protein
MRGEVRPLEGKQATKAAPNVRISRPQRRNHHRRRQCHRNSQSLPPDTPEKIEVVRGLQVHFVNIGRAIDDEKLFQYPFPEQLWTNIGNFVDNLARLPMWVDRPASLTVFGGKQTYAFWKTIFGTGTSPMGQRVMPSGLNIMDMIRA